MTYSRTQTCLLFLLLLNYCYGQNMSIITLNKTPNFFIDTEEWWGPDVSSKVQDKSIRPFRIEFNEQMIQDLRYRLLNHRPLTPALDGVSFRFGTRSQVVEEWVQHWANKYPFYEREKFLNQFPMYKTNVQGLDVQFIWVKPEVPPEVPVIPLLLVHGWPGSIREFYGALPLLTAFTDRGFAVEVVVPALPGFGYSESPNRPGLGGIEIAAMLRNLMFRLGHKQFYIQGGDLGAIVSSLMSTMFPETILGYHTNFAVTISTTALIMQFLGDLNPSLVVKPEYERRMYPVSKIIPGLLEEAGYFLEHATKPDTVGIGLSDSPTGLLAYILEKFSTGTNGPNRDLLDGGLNNMKKDFILDNIMMYWVPNSMTTSIRFYKNTFNSRLLESGLMNTPSPVPFWALQARTELVYQPPSILRVKYPNLINTTTINYGGHFFAFEQPEDFAKDVLDALGAFRRFHKENKFLSISEESKKNLTEVIEISRKLQHEADAWEIFRFPEVFVKQTLTAAQNEWLKMIKSK